VCGGSFEKPWVGRQKKELRERSESWEEIFDKKRTKINLLRTVLFGQNFQRSVKKIGIQGKLRPPRARPAPRRKRKKFQLWGEGASLKKRRRAAS